MNEQPQPVWLYGSVEACKNSIEAVIEDLQRTARLLDAVCRRMQEEQRDKERHNG